MDRNQRGRLRVWSAMCCLAAVLVSHVQAAIPQDPEASLAAEQTAALGAFNRLTILEAYREVGDRDPAWDEQTEAFFEGLVAYWSDPNRTPEQAEALAPLAIAAGRAGCEDPLFEYCVARIRWNMPSQGHYRAQYPMGVYKAARKLADSPYSSYRVFIALRNAHLALDGEAQYREQADEIWAHLLTSCKRMLQKEDAPRGHRRIAADWIGSWLDDLDGEQLIEVIDHLTQDDVLETWQVKYTLGVAHIKLAWQYRGGLGIHRDGRWLGKIQGASRPCSRISERRPLDGPGRSGSGDTNDRCFYGFQFKPRAGDAAVVQPGGAGRV